MKINNATAAFIFICALCAYLVCSGSSVDPGQPGAKREKAILLAAPSSSISVSTPEIEPVDLSIPMPPPPPAMELITSVDNRDAAPEAPHRTVWALVTGYCPCSRCCGSHANGRTSTGTSAWTRGAAADPKAVDYGTMIYVDGYGFTTIDDTGGAMRQSWKRRGIIQIDLRMTYHWQARQWGRKMMKVKIYDCE